MHFIEKFALSLRQFLSIINFLVKNLTIMKEKIGVNAGIVWNALNEGAKELKALKKATKLTEKDMYAALGWLAREEKVCFTENETDILVSLC